MRDASEELWIVGCVMRVKNCELWDVDMKMVLLKYWADIVNNITEVFNRQSKLDIFRRWKVWYVQFFISFFYEICKNEEFWIFLSYYALIMSKIERKIWNDSS